MTKIISYHDWCEYATMLGAKIEDGINWTWANNFPTRELAEEFINMFPEMETRGIYTNGPGFSVRFR